MVEIGESGQMEIPCLLGENSLFSGIRFAMRESSGWAGDALCRRHWPLKKMEASITTILVVVQLQDIIGPGCSSLHETEEARRRRRLRSVPFARESWHRG